MTSRWLGMCTVVAVQALVAASAASGEPISPAAGNRPGTVVTKGAISSGHSAASTSVPTPAQGVRMTIATFLEGQERFRKYDDDGAPKLVSARIAGPAEIAPMFSVKRTIYCVQVDLIMTNRMLWVTHDILEAFVTLLPGENGGQRIEGKVWSIDQRGSSALPCNHVPFTPFPELEHLRAQRRHALGKTDS
jgi:hypothetical protein